ncbi:MAG: transglutaminase family protein [Verrucomicrobiota bacterium]
MKYQIEHLTRYDYDQEVSASHHLAWLKPRSGAGQVVEDFSIRVEPTPAEVAFSVDYFGNEVQHFALQELHDSLTVVTRSEVSLVKEYAASAFVSPEWESVPEEVRTAEGGESLSAYEFTFASPYISFAPEYEEYAKPFFSSGTPLLEGVGAMTRQIHEDFRFDPTATTVATPLATVFGEKRGVCQDFAHFQIACLRMLGIPARYVSGYVRTEPPPGQARLLGADATHAWVAVFCPGLGWTEFDPTNNVIPSDTHVRVAYGRDYGDISPVRGTVVGGSGQRLTIGVTMTPLSE